MIFLSNPKCSIRSLEDVMGVAPSFRRKLGPSEFLAFAGPGTAKTSRLPEAEARRYLLHNDQLTALPMRRENSLTWIRRASTRMTADGYIQ